MERLNKINKWKYIRLFYILPCSVFSWGLLSNLHYLNQQSSFGISYKYVLTIPLLVFLYQSVRNSILGWVLTMSLWIIYLILLVSKIPENYQSSYDNPTVFGLYILVILVFLLIGVLYYLIRPKKNVF